MTCRDAVREEAAAPTSQRIPMPPSAVERRIRAGLLVIRFLQMRLPPR